MLDKHHQNKVRNSLYFDQDTKRLIEEKSAEFQQICSQDNQNCYLIGHAEEGDPHIQIA